MGLLTEQRIKQMIVEQIERCSSQLEGYQVFLFGSRASGQARERSDFDVGVLGSKPLPVDVFFAIEDAFDRLPTLHTIDWVDFGRVSEKFRHEALKHVEVIYG